MAERTLTGLSVLLQSNALKQALRPYCVGGPFGRLLDAEAERLGDADVQAFETEGLIGTGAAPAVLAYLFHRIEARLDGRPTLLIIDEGWLALDDPGFAAQLREWLKTLRKKNASVVFATQSLADIETSAIAPAIVESCPTRIFLPNERAIEPQITAIYRRFGLNDRQIEIIGRATPRAIITASPGAATGFSNSVSATPHLPSPQHRRRPTKMRSRRFSHHTAGAVSPPPGSATRARTGRRIPSPKMSPIIMMIRFVLADVLLGRGDLLVLIFRAPAGAHIDCSIPRILRRTLLRPRGLSIRSIMKSRAWKTRQPRLKTKPRTSPACHILRSPRWTSPSIGPSSC